MARNPLGEALSEYIRLRDSYKERRDAFPAAHDGFALAKASQDLVEARKRAAFALFDAWERGDITIRYGKE